MPPKKRIAEPETPWTPQKIEWFIKIGNVPFKRLQLTPWTYKIDLLKLKHYVL